MNKNLGLLALCQGLFLTNNVTFIAINGLVGLSLAPLGWMATLPVTGYVVGAALSAMPVARLQARVGRRRALQGGLAGSGPSAALAPVAGALGHLLALAAAPQVGGRHNPTPGPFRLARPLLGRLPPTVPATVLVLPG